MINGVQTELVSIRDRGLQYGDGCFETILLLNHSPVLLQEHLGRLARACELLRLALDLDALKSELAGFCRQCPASGIVKIIITRGVGGRGYSADNVSMATRILQYSAIPDTYHMNTISGISLGIAAHRLSASSTLAGIKHLNRLDQVLCSFDLRPPFDEVLCLDETDRIIEGSRSNLVCVINGEMQTPLLDKAGVEGVMLGYLGKRFGADSVSIRARALTLHDLADASELFLCNSVFGVWPVRSLHENATVHSWSTGPLTQQAIRYQHELFTAAK